MSLVVVPIFSTTATLVLGPPDRPPNGTLASEIMRHYELRALFCPPVVAEQLVQDPEGINQAKKLDFLLYASGPLTEPTGNRLSQVTDVASSIAKQRQARFKHLFLCARIGHISSGVLIMKLKCDL